MFTCLLLWGKQAPLTIRIDDEVKFLRKDLQKSKQQMVPEVSVLSRTNA